MVKGPESQACQALKNTFVLDENVIIAASRGSQNAVHLLTLIVRNCHHIAVNSRLLASYQRVLRRRSAPPQLTKVVEESKRYTGKWVTVSRTTSRPARIPIRDQDDVFLVRIAQGTGSPSTFIVTGDKNTQKDINEKTELRALTVRQALSYARQVDS